MAIQRMNDVERSAGEIVKALGEADRNAFVNKILALNAKIEGLRTQATQRTATLNGLKAAAEARKGQVQKVVDFFAPAQVPPAP